MFKKNDYLTSNKDETYSGVASFIIEIVKVIFWAIVIIFPVRAFLFQPFFVQGASMQPNFENGQYLIINEIGYKQTEIRFKDNLLFSIKPFRLLERGDVVVFRYPKDPRQYFIKRVIALPGETINISEGRIVIYNAEHPDGFVLDESHYLSPNVLTTGELTKKLGDDQYFVMGDNRSASHDSRSWGPLSKDKIIGKVLLRAWPLGKASVF